MLSVFMFHAALTSNANNDTFVDRTTGDQPYDAKYLLLVYRSKFYNNFIALARGLTSVTYPYQLNRNFSFHVRLVKNLPFERARKTQSNDVIFMETYFFQVPSKNFQKTFLSKLYHKCFILSPFLFLYTYVHVYVCRKRKSGRTKHL